MHGKIINHPKSKLFHGKAFLQIENFFLQIPQQLKTTTGKTIYLTFTSNFQHTREVKKLWARCKDTLKAKSHLSFTGMRNSLVKEDELSRYSTIIKLLCRLENFHCGTHYCTIGIQTTLPNSSGWNYPWRLFVYMIIHKN